MAGATYEAESLTAPHSAHGEPVLLNLGGRAFLSHSGQDKDFVRRLNKDIRRYYRGIEVTFFDEETLPKGKPISMEKSIVEAARGSALGVLVLTDDFFTHTPNPMLELEAFVAGKVDLLPLFFTLSVEEFKEEKRWDRWEKKWKEWAAADDKLVIEKWRSYLKLVRTYNGLEFCKIAPCGKQDLYIDEVVKQVARIIGPVVPMSGDDVYGKDRLCRTVDDMYKRCTSKRSSPMARTPPQIASTSANCGFGENNGLDAYDMVGIHGFSGVGKTTLCKCLRDFYFRDMKGKVCYINLGLSSELRPIRMQHVLSGLDRGNAEDFHSLQLDDIPVETLLRERLSCMKDPVFLAIDNIVEESQDEALTYLTCKFPKGSKILITSMSESILRNVCNLLPDSFSFSVVIEYMPALELEEARDIFQHGFPELNKHRRSNVLAIEENLQRDVDACVSMCTIFSGKRYHPLMLKSLAACVRAGKGMHHRDKWKRRLAKLASEGIAHKNDAWEQVFQVFDISYRLLAKEAKQVFLDLALCYTATISTYPHMNYYEWIKMLHSTHLSEQNFEKILLQLQALCFIEGQNSSHISIEMQDLLVDYGKHKLRGDDIPDGYLVLMDGASDWRDALPSRATHVSISRCGKELRSLDLRGVKGVTVLHLLDNPGLEEVLLSCTSSARLRSMIVSVPAHIALRCIVQEDWIRQSLKWFELKGNISFCSQSQRSLLMLPDAAGPMFLGGFRNLELLSLDSLMPSSSCVRRMDLTACTNLKWFKVTNMPGLRSIQGVGSSSHLERVDISKSPHLEELALNVPANSKRSFRILDCASLQRLSLNCTTPSGRRAAELESCSLEIKNCPLLANIYGLSEYTDGFNIFYLSLEGSAQQYMYWQEIFADMVKDTGIDSSGCKATVRDLQILTCNPVGLGGVTSLDLEDAQQIGPLISALFQAQPSNLVKLRVRCQQAGDESCGCGQNPPNFCTLPLNTEAKAEFQYCCPQVRDLASLAQWNGLHTLSLRGCKSVEVWPDFAAMTSLFWLDLSDTSLREWPPADVQHLAGLFLSGCPQLPAKELMLGLITSARRWTIHRVGHVCQCAFSALTNDLRDGSRDRRTVAVALGELSVELAAFFDGWSLDYTYPQLERDVLKAVLDLIYEVWFKVRVSADEEQRTAKKRRLLSSESFLSLSFSKCRDLSDLPSHTQAVMGVLGIALLGGGASSACSYSALSAVNDHHLQESTILFCKNILHFLLKFIKASNSRKPLTDEKILEMVRKRVRMALCRMAREAGLEVEEGDTECEALQLLRERAVEALSTLPMELKGVLEKIFLLGIRLSRVRDFFGA